MAARTHKQLISKTRTIMAIELEQDVARQLEAVCSELGISQITVTSRLMRWFAAQPAEVQSRILGMHGDAESHKVARTLLRRIAEGQS